MVSQKITIQVEQGLHARPAGILVREATKCACNVFVVVNEKKIQAKSILNIMAAGIKFGTEIEVICDGENEQECLAKLISTIENDLGE